LDRLNTYGVIQSEHIDDQVHRNLSDLVDFDDVSCLDLEFVVSEDHLGESSPTYAISGVIIIIFKFICYRFDRRLNSVQMIDSMTMTRFARRLNYFLL
jgi:hypothetical protein